MNDIQTIFATRNSKIEKVLINSNGDHPDKGGQDILHVSIGVVGRRKVREMLHKSEQYNDVRNIISSVFIPA